MSLYNPETGGVVKRYKPLQEGWCNANGKRPVEFTGNGRYLFSGCYIGILRQYTLTGDNEIRELDCVKERKYLGNQESLSDSDEYEEQVLEEEYGWIELIGPTLDNRIEFITN